MQNAKDTFYEVIRARLAAVNPGRTMVVRGVTRPGLLVEENELSLLPVVPDCFRLRWSGIEIDEKGTLPLAKLRCELLYETAGTELGAGLDRGRSLEAMDAELLSALSAAPMRAPKMSFAALTHGGSTASLQSAVWWGTPVFAGIQHRGERIGRTVTVMVMSYQEAGEM